MLSAAGELAKPLILNREVPDERAQILRKAFAEMVKDKAFVADAEKTHQAVSATLGDAALRILDEIYSSPPDTVQAARAIAND